MTFALLALAAGIGAFVGFLSGITVRARCDSMIDELAPEVEASRFVTSVETKNRNFKIGE